MIIINTNMQKFIILFKSDARFLTHLWLYLQAKMGKEKSSINFAEF